MTLNLSMAFIDILYDPFYILKIKQYIQKFIKLLQSVIFLFISKFV